MTIAPPIGRYTATVLINLISLPDLDPSAGATRVTIIPMASSTSRAASNPHHEVNLPSEDTTVKVPFDEIVLSVTINEVTNHQTFTATELRLLDIPSLSLGDVAIRTTLSKHVWRELRLEPDVQVAIGQTVRLGFVYTNYSADGCCLFAGAKLVPV